MKLVLDTNILVTFFKKDSLIKFLIINSKSSNLQLFSPEKALEELILNKQDVLKYSRLSLTEFENKLKELKQFIKFSSSKLFKSFESRAKQLAPHNKDIPFFALALKLNCAIWSNEFGFKKQSSIKIFSTKDFLKPLKKRVLKLTELKRIISKSKLSSKDAKELADKVNEGMLKKLKNKFPELGL